MNVSRRSFLAAAGLVSSLSALDRLTTPAEGAGAPAGVVTLPPVPLRGYGTLSATFRRLHAGQSSVTHITCESPQKAHLVQAKYLSDLGLLPGTSEAAVSVMGRLVPVRRLAQGGAVACFAHGTDVLLFAAASGDLLRETRAVARLHSTRLLYSGSTTRRSRERVGIEALKKPARVFVDDRLGDQRLRPTRAGPGSAGPGKTTRPRYR